MKKKILIALLILILVFLIWWLWPETPAQDEAMEKGIPVESFRQAEDEADYFRDADGGIDLTPAEVRGRNTWWIWTGGNEAFWDWLANNSFGTHDLLKVVSSYPCDPSQQGYEKYGGDNVLASSGTYGESHGEGYGGYGDEYGGDGGYKSVCADTMYPEDGHPTYAYYDRDTRFCYAGMINEPGFRKPTKKDEYGLCLDERVAPPEPFDEEVYGRPSGIMGLRIYKNPNFENSEKAQADWDAEKYYNDPSYFSNTKLVRPYRVGMSCGFCHISHHPLHPPEDASHPEYANMSGTIGAQYFWFGRVFAANVTPDNLVYHLLDANRPGAVDTSFVPADNLLNPRAMNALFNLGARVGIAQKIGTETSTGGALDLPEVAGHQEGDSSTFEVPHVLWDGADSVGIDAALTRVYINIGEYHQQWIRTIDAVVGFRKQSPIKVIDAQENSVYWNATQERSKDLLAYLIRAGYPYPLATARANEQAGSSGDDGDGYGDDGNGEGGYGEGGYGEDAASDAGAENGGNGENDGSESEGSTTLEQGKIAFADNCARCHSSKLPEPLVGLGEEGCIGPDYLDCWKRYWEWTETDDFKRQMREIVLRDDFLDGNYLSTDARIPAHQPLIDFEPTGIDPSASTLERYLEEARQRGIATGALEGELCSPMASNAIAGHVWDNFSSQSYKSLSSVGTVKVYNPITDEVTEWEAPAGGRGYQRVPSLVSIWTTAPYLHNNELGHFTGDPSVQGRMAAFEDGIRKLLWPELRANHVPRTDRVTYLLVEPSALPGLVRALLPLRGLFGLGFLVNDDGQVQVGPFPGPSSASEGTPVSLVANLNLARTDADFGLFGLLGTVRRATKDFKRIEREQLGPEESAELLRGLVPDLLDKSACPDFIVDRGHYFGTDLTDAEKEALIELIKTL